MMDGDTILKKDGKPWNEDEDDPALIDWIANDGARVSAIFDALSAAPLEPSASDLREAALESTAPNPVELARGSTPAADVETRSPGGGAVV
jgi:endonuclease G